MLTRILLLLGAFMLPTAAIAQDSYKPGLNVTDTNPSPQKAMCWNGTAYVNCPTPGTSPRPSGAAADQIQGNMVNGAPVAGNPVQVAGSDGTNVRTLRTNSLGGLFIASGSGTNVPGGTISADGVPATNEALRTVNFGYVFNGTTWDRLRGDTSGLNVNTSPTAGAASAITPALGSLVSSITAKAAPGNLYSTSVTTGAAAVYLYVFNAVAAPADGAVVAGTASGNYQICSAVAATATFTTTFEVPERYSVGITPVVSSTACGTLTKVATAVLLKARVQ